MMGEPSLKRLKTVLPVLSHLSVPGMQAVCIPYCGQVLKNIEPEKRKIHQYLSIDFIFPAPVSMIHLIQARHTAYIPAHTAGHLSGEASLP